MFNNIDHDLKKANTMLHGAENHIRGISKDGELFHARCALVELLHASSLMLRHIQKNDKEIHGAEDTLQVLVQRMNKGNL